MVRDVILGQLWWRQKFAWYRHYRFWKWQSKNLSQLSNIYSCISWTLLTYLMNSTHHPESRRWGQSCFWCCPRRFYQSRPASPRTSCGGTQRPWRHSRFVWLPRQPRCWNVWCGRNWCERCWWQGSELVDERGSRSPEMRPPHFSCKGKQECKYSALSTAFLL